MQDPKNNTVLIVDDDEDLRDVIAFDFIRKGFKIFTAANGREAFNIVKNEKIDIVISDVRMPGGDGVELLDRVREYDLELPVVMFITGFSDLTVEEAYHRGANALFLKPFDRDLLMNTVYRSLIEKEEKQKNQPPGSTNVKMELRLSNVNQTIDEKNFNLGRGGLSVSLNTPLPQVDDKINFIISFSQDNMSPIEGVGIVRWVKIDPENVNLPNIGIEFITMQEEARNEIIKMVDSMSIKSYIPAR